MLQPKALFAVMLALFLTGCAATGGETRSGAKSSPKAPRNDAAELQIKLGRGYMEKGEFETAHEKLENAIRLDPRSVDAQTLMAVLYERINRPQLSEKFYQRAVELDPEDGSTNNNFGAYLCRLGRFDEADGYFLKALNDPFYKTPSAALSNAGVCAARAGHVRQRGGDRARVGAARAAVRCADRRGARRHRFRCLALRRERAAARQARRSAHRARRDRRGAADELGRGGNEFLGARVSLCIF